MIPTFPLAFRIAAAVAILVTIGAAFTLDYPPIDVVQRGYRGVGMNENYNPRLLARQEEANIVPAELPLASPAGPKAGEVYHNVRVLGDLSVGQFTRVMATITNWVAPKQGCAYCHAGANLASDALYTKVVSRRMLQMTRHINADWQTHVQNVGVTCWTCHRGNSVPSQIWFTDPGPPHAGGVAQDWSGKNHPAAAINDTSLPADPFTPFLLHDAQIRIQSETALPTNDYASIKQTDWTYALMIHFSQALGVNCTYCHNSREWRDWSQSTPQRVTAWYGIRMVRNLNNAYLQSIADVFPANRLGPTGDVPKINCATCHQGAFKPLYGADVLKDNPELAGPSPETLHSAATAPASTAVAATSPQ